MDSNGDSFMGDFWESIVHGNLVVMRMDYNGIFMGFDTSIIIG